MKKALIVEDEIALMKAITQKIKKANFIPYTARSVDEAEQIINRAEVDFIWLDHYLLGERSGLDLIKVINHNKKYAKIPIILVSNTCSDEKVEEYKKMGVSRYFVKSSVRLDEIISEAVSICAS